VEKNCNGLFTAEISKEATNTLIGLFVHGDDDDRNVPFQQTTDLVEKLRGQKVEFDKVIFPDEIHDVLRRNDSART